MLYSSERELSGQYVAYSRSIRQTAVSSTAGGPAVVVGGGDSGHTGGASAGTEFNVFLTAVEFLFRNSKKYRVTTKCLTSEMELL